VLTNAQAKYLLGDKGKGGGTSPSTSGVSPWRPAASRTMARVEAEFQRMLRKVLKDDADRRL